MVEANGDRDADSVQTLTRRVERLRLLLDLGVRFQAERDFRALLGQVWSNLTEALNAERSSLFLLDADAGELYSVIAQDAKAIRFPADQGIAGAVVQSKEPVLVPDAYADPRFNPEVDRKTGYRTRSILGAPLLSSTGDCIGVAQVLNRRDGRPFDDDDLDLLTSLAAFAGVAVETHFLIEEQREATEAVITALVTALEMRSPAERRHSQEVRALSRFLAEMLGLEQDRIRFLEWAAALHDVGKLATPDAVLNKESVLTEEERHLFDQHALVTRRVLEAMGLGQSMPRVVEAAALHHRGYDGSGIPENGPSGAALPLEARILAVADRFSLLSHGRWGRSSLSTSAALAEIMKESGKAFDPRVVAALHALGPDLAAILESSGRSDGQGRKTVTLTVDPKRLSDGEGAAKAATSLENLPSMAPSELRRTLTRLEILRNVMRRLASERDLDRLLTEILSSTTEVLEADRSTLFLLERDEEGRRWLSSKVAQGVDAIRIPLDRTSVAGAVVLDEAICNIKEAYEDPRFRKEVDRKTGYRTKTILACPLKSPDGRVVGVVQALNKKSGVFDLRDEELIQTLASLAAVAVENARWLAEQRQTFETLISGQAVAIDARDHVTGGHTWRVTAFAVEVGRTMGLGPEEMELLRFSGLLHDQGKLGVPDDILLKPGRLSDWEFELMRSHASKTKEILEGVRHLFPRRLRQVVDIAPAHHEKLDGTGYPDGLVADRIHPLARILAVADIFDALTADRPYRKPLPDPKVVEILRGDVAAGKLDSESVEALSRSLEQIARIRTEVNAQLERRHEAEAIRGLVFHQ